MKITPSSQKVNYLQTFKAPPEEGSALNKKKNYNEDKLSVKSETYYPKLNAVLTLVGLISATSAVALTYKVNKATLEILKLVTPQKAKQKNRASKAISMFHTFVCNFVPYPILCFFLIGITGPVKKGGI